MQPSVYYTDPAVNRAHVVPHAADFCAVLVAIFVAVTNGVALAERVDVQAVPVAERVHRQADADPERFYLYANTDAERFYLHADTHRKRVHAHADAEGVCHGHRAAVAHRFGVGLVAGVGIAHGVVVDGSAVGVSHGLVPTSRNGGGRCGDLWRNRRPIATETTYTCSALPITARSVATHPALAQTITRAGPRPRPRP